MKERANLEGQQSAMQHSECRSRERGTDPYRIKQISTCLLLKIIISLCVEWAQAARSGSERFIFFPICFQSQEGSNGMDCPPPRTQFSPADPYPWADVPVRPHTTPQRFLTACSLLGLWAAPSARRGAASPPLIHTPTLDVRLLKIGPIN